MRKDKKMKLISKNTILGQKKPQKYHQKWEKMMKHQKWRLKLNKQILTLHIIYTFQLNNLFSVRLPITNWLKKKQ